MAPAKTPATRPTGEDVNAFLDTVTDDRRRADAHALRALMERVTGARAEMWGTAIVGFGSAPYTNTSGTTDWFIVGFSPRKAALTLYGVYDDARSDDPLLAALGPHSTGKGCLYVPRLDAVDGETLEALIRSAWDRAGQSSPA